MDEIRIDQTIRTAMVYPIRFTRDAFHRDNATLDSVLSLARSERKLLACLDAGLIAAQPDLIPTLLEYCSDRGIPLVESPLILPGGESVKEGWTHVVSVLERMERHALCRHSVVLAIGGGAMLDAVGMAAALFHRGVRLVRMPSTTLAQADSGVGVKNGVNWRSQKNLLGCFAPPHAVVCDLSLLRSLPHRLVLDGIAEAIKVAVIRDAEFFAELAASADRLAACDWDAVEAAVSRSAAIHARHIAEGGDPFERGASRPLDFGHWAAHRLEILSNYELRHGRAVAIGIAIDTAYARRIELLPEAESRAILGLIEQIMGPNAHPLLSSSDPLTREALLAGIEHFREHLGGRLAITLPTAIGRAIEVDQIDRAILAECLEQVAGR